MICEVCNKRKYRYYNFKTQTNYCSECYVEYLATELSNLRASLAWHDYPAEKPNVDIEYDIILESGFIDKPIKDKGQYYNNGEWSANSTRICKVIAYREPIAPYEVKK